MKVKQPNKNLAESIYNRLKNVAYQKNRPVQEIFKYYAIERFLYRLETVHKLLLPGEKKIFVLEDLLETGASSDELV